MESHRRVAIDERSDTVSREDLRKPQSKEEAQEWGRRGGIASGQARRQKKAMRELAENLLNATIKDEAYLERMKDMGFKTKGLKMSEGMIIGQILKAMEGDPRCFKEILELVEPKDEIKTTEVEDLSPLAELLKIGDDEDGQSN